MDGSDKELQVIAESLTTSTVCKRASALKVARHATKSYHNEELLQVNEVALSIAENRRNKIDNQRYMSGKAEKQKL